MLPKTLILLASGACSLLLGAPEATAFAATLNPAPVIGILAQPADPDLTPVGAGNKSYVVASYVKWWVPASLCICDGLGRRWRLASPRLSATGFRLLTNAQPTVCVCRVAAAGARVALLRYDSSPEQLAADIAQLSGIVLPGGHCGIHNTA